jgi:hypothetical protein
MVAADWSALIVFVLLCASAGLGRFVRPRLPEDHRKPETVAAMQLMIGMLVTFTAIVLGLLTASVKTAHDSAGRDLQEYALQLTQLDRCLRNYGPGTEAAQDLLTNYTATLIASTWTSEPPPAMPHPLDTAGIPRVGPSPTMASLLNQTYLALRRLQPPSSFQAGVRDDCLSLFSNVLATRRAAIEDDRSPISTPFFLVLVFWLVATFASIGLVAPRNALSLAGIVLVAISLSLAIFVIFGLNPYFVAFSSSDMRDALAAMTAREP